MDVRKSVALVMITLGAAILSVAVAGAVFGDDWDHSSWDHNWDRGWDHNRGHDQGDWEEALDDWGEALDDWEIDIEYSGPLDHRGSGYSGPLDDPD